MSVSYMAYLLLNIILCIDITLMIKGPFGSKEKRIKLYYTFTMIASVLFGVVVIFDIKTSNARNFSATIMFAVILVYIGISIYSGLFCLIRLRNSGLS